jgi:peptide-methionine (R)-S-oxide reductase
MNENEWRVKLSPEQFSVLREGATEAPFTGEYNSNKKEGAYKCGGCGEKLFMSDKKFDSGSGWPSFTEAAGQSVEEKSDASHGMVRTEILCTNCGGHLGHVFPDGPSPNGMRYCINSLSLDFEPNE